MENITVANHQQAARALTEKLQRQLPIMQALGVEVVDYDGERLRVKLPLEPNYNDKQTAFAGSIASAGALSGWALLMLACEPSVGRVDVAIYRCELDYKRPIRKDFWGEAALPAGGIDELLERLQSKGKGRMELDITVNDEDGVAAVLHGAYAVRIPEKSTP